MIFVECLSRDGTVLKSEEVTSPQDIVISLPGKRKRLHMMRALPETGIVRTYTPKLTRRDAFEYFTLGQADVQFNPTVDDSLSVQLGDRKTIECRARIRQTWPADWGAESTAGFRVTWHPDGEPFTDEEKRRIAQAQYSKAANTMVATQNVLLL